VRFVSLHLLHFFGKEPFQGARSQGGETKLATVVMVAIDDLARKSGEISTDFEVKQRRSARRVGIDHSEPGETAPCLVSPNTIL
jgi:hypothetical protein